jgi:hypothetical protein
VQQLRYSPQGGEDQGQGQLRRAPGGDASRVAQGHLTRDPVQFRPQFVGTGTECLNHPETCHAGEALPMMSMSWVSGGT